MLEKPSCYVSSTREKHDSDKLQVGKQAPAVEILYMDM